MAIPDGLVLIAAFALSYSFKKGLALVLWVRIMQASDSTKLLFYPFAIKKVPQLRLFPSVACSSYFGYFVQFSRCGSDLKSDSNTCQNKCLNPNSASCKVFFASFLFQKKEGGGDKRDRTVDPLLAKQVLSQLSYTPTSSHIKGGGPKWTRTTDLTIISRAL